MPPFDLALSPRKVRLIGGVTIVVLVSGIRVFKCRIDAWGAGSPGLRSRVRRVTAGSVFVNDRSKRTNRPAEIAV